MNFQKFMSCKINLINYEKCYPSRMKKYFKRNINYSFYDKIIPHVKQQTVGNLPPEIIKFFEKDKEAKIKAFQDILAQMANHIRTTRKHMKADHVTSFKDYYSSEKIKIYEQDVSKLLNEKMSAVFGNELNAELKYTNNGGFAELFRLSLKDKNGKKIMHDKAFKVFYNIIEPLQENKRKHNNFAEANFWTYISYISGHKLDKTQFTRHYISDMKNGYYLTEFIDQDIYPTTARLHLKQFGIKFIDWKHNQPLGTKDFYDGGGFIKRPNFIDDKVVLKYFKKIINRNTEKERLEVLANQEKMIDNPKTPHRDKIKKANELYKQYKEQETINTARKNINPLIIIKKIINFCRNKLFKHQ